MGIQFLVVLWKTVTVVQIVLSFQVLILNIFKKILSLVFALLTITIYLDASNEHIENMVISGKVLKQ